MPFGHGQQPEQQNENIELGRIDPVLNENVDDEQVDDIGRKQQPIGHQESIDHDHDEEQAEMSQHDSENVT